MRRDSQPRDRRHHRRAGGARFPHYVWREGRTIGTIETVAAARLAAKGEYVLWLDNESWIGPDYVAAGVDFLDNNAAHALVCGSATVRNADGASETAAPTPVAFEDGGRRVESLIGNISGSGAWQGVFRRNVFAELPLHQGLGFAYGCLISTAWRGKIGAVPEMALHRDGSADEADASEQCEKLRLGSFQATDPWLSVSALVFCNIAFFDNAFASLPGVERLRLAVAAADAVSRRWKIMDESMFVSFASRIFPSENMLERFRALRTGLAETVLGLGSTASIDPYVQNLIGIINVLCRMRIGNIPLTKEDRDIVHRMDDMWDNDKSVEAQNKLAIVSAMYL